MVEARLMEALLAEGAVRQQGLGEAEGIGSHRHLGFA